MTRAERFIRNAKCKLGDRSTMSNSAQCDLNKDCTVLKLHDICHNPKCNCQKQITFTPRQFQLEGGSIKSKLQKKFKGTQTAWNRFLNVVAPFTGMAVSAKTKNPRVGQATTILLKSISGGKILSLTDMHGNGLRLKLCNSVQRQSTKKMSNCIKELYDYDLVKKCSKYGIISLKNKFHRDLKKYDWLTSHCKLCQKIYRKNIILNMLIQRLLDVENKYQKNKKKLKNLVVIIGKIQINMSKTKKNQISTSNQLVFYDQDYHQHSNLSIQIKYLIYQDVLIHFLKDGSFINSMVA